jgi:predicted nucleic acid-binding Zn ribbon protein
LTLIILELRCTSTKYSTFLYYLSVHTMPKSLHCLNMILTIEYLKPLTSNSDGFYPEKFDMPKYTHYVIFSKHVLVSSVIVNSRVMCSEVCRKKRRKQRKIQISLVFYFTFYELTFVMCKWKSIVVILAAVPLIFKIISCN